MGLAQLVPRATEGAKMSFTKVCSDVLTRFCAMFVTFALCVVVCFGCASRPPLPAAALSLNRGGADAAASGDGSTAEARLSLAIEYNPRFTEAWVNLGLVELRRGNLDVAQKHFEKSRDLNADIPTPHHGLGLVAERRGMGKSAERHYRAALAVDPGFVPARVNLARQLYARGAFDEARMEFLRLTQVASHEPAGFVGLGLCLENLGRETEADEVVASGASMFPAAAEVSLLVAHRALRRGFTVEAERRLAFLTECADHTIASQALAHMALIRLGAGDREEALRLARRALTKDEQTALAKYVLVQSAP
jgi:Flp pilus assembly protein TadD